MGDLISIGNAAATYQRDPRAIETRLVEARSNPVLTLDGVRYFRAADLSRALARRRRGERVARPNPNA